MKSTGRCFHTQLRAILRASAHGALKIMIPMVSSMEDPVGGKSGWRRPNSRCALNRSRLMKKIPLGIIAGGAVGVMFIIVRCCERGGLL